nr:hypothetical protein [Tanacetum cinerariifolium]
MVAIFKEYDLKHQMAMLSIKVHRFEKKHGRKIKFNGRENARFDKKLVKCFNYKQMGHFSRECRAQGGQNSNNYQKYKSKEARKDESGSKAMVVVDGSIDWDKQTEGGNTEPRSLENFGMIAKIKIESDADSEGEVVSVHDVIPVGVYVPAGTVAAAVVSPQSETEFALMGLSTEDGKSVPGINSRDRKIGKKGTTLSSREPHGTYGMAIDYCIMKEEMSIVRGRKSVPGMNSSEREMER